jgi:hypothetical protein
MFCRGHALQEVIEPGSTALKCMGGKTPFIDTPHNAFKDSWALNTAQKGCTLTASGTCPITGVPVQRAATGGTETDHNVMAAVAAVLDGASSNGSVSGDNSGCSSNGASHSNSGSIRHQDAGCDRASSNCSAAAGRFAPLLGACDTLKQGKEAQNESEVRIITANDNDMPSV